MLASKRSLRQAVFNALKTLIDREQIDGEPITIEDIVTEKPPRSEMGDLAFPMFQFASVFKKAPNIIAADVKELLETSRTDGDAFKIEIKGPYLNVFVERDKETEKLTQSILEMGARFGSVDQFAGQRFMIEFSCPNTNKPLHLGHLRNDAIGETVAHILEANGAEVKKVNLINDRGIHICKSMAAYKKYGNNTDPAETGVKSDHFVGDFYVRFNEWAAEDPAAEEEARELLRKWENNDPDTYALWNKMNGWAIDGIKETYEKTGVSFDEYYFESETYLKGKEEVLKGLDKGVFYKKEDSSIWVDLSDIDLDKKVLLRSDGTSLYLTQDIGTAILRFNDWGFNRLIYVVGSEQEYHFKVLFNVLDKLGFSWAKDLYHLSYGMVYLPEGKMKSREGTVVDADNLLEDLHRMAIEEIRTREREKEVGDVRQTAWKIAIGALNYYLLQASPTRDISFNPKESISFVGNTGPYLQYMGARISSILRKYEERFPKASENLQFQLLNSDEEWELVKLLATFPETVNQSGKELNPSLIASFLYELAKAFSRFYHDRSVLNNENEDLIHVRVALVKAVSQVLQNAFSLLAIPFLEIM